MAFSFLYNVSSRKGGFISMASKKTIPMRIVKEKTGLTSRQIRYYDQMGLIFPERTSGNQRLFSESDLKRLERIRSLLDDGYTIEMVKNKFNPQLSVQKSTVVNFNKRLDRYFKGELSSLYPDLKDPLKKNKYSKE
jgi:MerR family transcriptional regulator, glutamine synthetase repressor